MKSIISIIVIIISITTFVLIVKPQYNEIKTLQVKETELKGVLDNARRLQIVRNSLLDKRKEISEFDIRRLEKLIPESADNVKLIIEFEQIAERNNLNIQKAAAVKTSVEENNSQVQGFDIETKEYGVVTLDFTLLGGYREMISFLKDIEKNLRITDIRSFSINPPADIDSDYSYSLTIDTYWLKDNI